MEAYLTKQVAYYFTQHIVTKLSYYFHVNFLLLLIKIQEFEKINPT